jgi:hypothetical protein
MTKISVITQDYQEESKSALPKFGKKLKETNIDNKVLQDNMENFLNNLTPVLNTKKDVGEFEIDEIELNITISATGGIQIIGKK